MEITYLGHSCFKIKGKDVTLAIDPFDDKIGLKMPAVEADVLLTTHDHFDHYNVGKISGHKLHIDGPGEYEISGVAVWGMKTFHDDQMGAERGTNTIYQIEIDGFTLLHLGDLGHELAKETIEKLSEIDVLMIPVGGTFTIGPKLATKVISSLEPRIIVPMHFQTDKLDVGVKLNSLDDFLDEMGVESPKTLSKLNLKSRSDVPSETEVIVISG